jgi:hypothetical protein
LRPHPHNRPGFLVTATSWRASNILAKPINLAPSARHPSKTTAERKTSNSDHP